MTYLARHTYHSHDCGPAVPVSTPLQFQIRPHEPPAGVNVRIMQTNINMRQIPYSMDILLFVDASLTLTKAVYSQQLNTRTNLWIYSAP